jgi:hypothetical protein
VPEDITQELLKLTIKKKNKKTGGQAGDYDHLLLDPEEVRVGLMPNGQMHHLAKAWMSVFFQMVGDQIPNSNEIHLETQDKLEIWAEYVWDMHFLGEYEALCYTKFLELWDLVFPHVRIRVYKAVTGKCTIIISSTPFIPSTTPFILSTAPVVSQASALSALCCPILGRNTSRRR